MKTFLKILAVALVATAPQLTGDTHAATSQNLPTGNLLTAQVNADEAPVPVALPNLADVLLNGGESSSGRVTAIDSQKLSLQRDSNSTSIPLSQVKKVVFRESGLVYKASGQPVIRGDGTTPAAKQAVWSGVPLNAFRVQDPLIGQAEVRLGPPVVTRLRLQGIVSVAKDRTYVVDEIQFDLQKRTMTIMATPY
ncbi:hypothetical protein [Aerosakkonema funiforme]|uniref:hypothetical protein n=1 Tax=Aerosakkonema funiforme TaxID=1246630 RepID=UPI0035BB8754